MPSVDGLLYAAIHSQHLTTPLTSSTFQYRKQTIAYPSGPICFRRTPQTSARPEHHFDERKAMTILDALPPRPCREDWILCVPSGWETYISLEFHELHQGLEARGWTRLVIGEVEDTTIVAAIRNASVVLLWEAYEFIERNTELLTMDAASDARSATRRIVFCDDVHYFTAHRRQQRLRAFCWADRIMATYPDKLIEWYPEIATKPIHWTPHAASSYFQRAAAPSSDRVLLSGSRSWPYPFRQFCREKLPESVCTAVDHPGYPGYPGDQANAMKADSAAMQQRGQERYAALLSAHPAMLVCGSIFGYLVAKVFEGMAAGCLVIAERASLGKRLSLLGFSEGEHYVGTDLLHVIEDVTRVREAYLGGAPDWRRMVDLAANKVYDLHTTAVRAAQIHLICTE